MISKLITRRQAIVSISAVTAVACAPPPTPAPPTSVPKPATYRAVVANSELTVGRNRLSVGLIGPDSRPVSNARVEFGLFKIDGDKAVKRSDAGAVFRWVENEARGVYAAQVDFDAPGRWGVEVRAAIPDRADVAARANLDVKERGSSPALGVAPPASRTLTVNTAADPTLLCSSAPACEFHAMSVHELLAAGKPGVVLFASPGYCLTATCLPQLSAVRELSARLGSAVNIVHVEVYKDVRNQVVADAVTEWGLLSEPWIFLTDRKGVIADRFEGVAPADELEAALRTLI